MTTGRRMFGLSALAWAVAHLAWFGVAVGLSPLREFDIYNIDGGLRVLTEQPVLLIIGQLLLAWAGVALVGMALALPDWIPAEARSYRARAGLTFGLIGAAFFLFAGLVGGLSSFEMHYIQSIRSLDYIRGAYLPLALITNRAHAAAITVGAIWFVSANRDALRAGALPAPLAYSGLGAGALALLGFFLPGGGFSQVHLLITILWGFAVAWQLRRVD